MDADAGRAGVVTAKAGASRAPSTTTVRNPSNALEVERLTVRFGATTVLDALSFDVPSATSLAIIGPNGAGKTVLFKALIGALPIEGEVRWASSDPARLRPPEARRRAGPTRDGR